MFFSLYVQQNQWIWVTLLGGLALAILLCLSYSAMWRPRVEERKQESRVEIRGPVTFFRWVISFVPWVLILIVMASFIFTITHLYMAATSLPNW